MTREEAINAMLIVKQYCTERTLCKGCPLYNKLRGCCIVCGDSPNHWNIKIMGDEK